MYTTIACSELINMSNRKCIFPLTYAIKYSYE